MGGALIVSARRDEVFSKPIEQLMDVLELSLLLQKALFLQCVGDLRDQSPPEAAEIGKGREYPYWRDAKRRDAEQLYGMTHAAPCKKVLRLRHFAG